MKFFDIGTIALFLCCVCQTFAFYKYGKPSSRFTTAEDCDDCGVEVCITDYILSGNVNEAREATRVVDVFPDVDSYAGYANVNATAKNKLFFWYVPSLDKNSSAPLLIWLQGGPGSSSLFGMFTEMGPFEVQSDGTSLSQREFSWNSHYSMIFIDNPVGAGYSYTETSTGYCTSTKHQVSSQLFELMQQFYQVFPEQLENDLYITGESYAGKYVPGLAFKIHEENAALLKVDGGSKPQNVRIPLAGLAIGDGWTDPFSMLTAYPDMMFDIGAADINAKAVFQEFVDLTRDYIAKGDMYNAFTVWDKMINGDIFPYPNYFHNVSGLNDYDNYMNTNSPPELGYYYRFVMSPRTRKGIHVGRNTYGGNAGTCEMNLVEDFMVSFRAEVEVLMENYKTLIYSGQLDVIIGAALTEKMFATFRWDGKEEFLMAKKSVWRVNSNDREVAGYVKQSGMFTQAVVRGAGHLVPFDQPQRALDLINRWIQGLPFPSLVDPAKH